MALTPEQQKQLDALSNQLKGLQDRIKTEGITDSSGRVLLSPGAYNTQTNVTVPPKTTTPSTTQPTTPTPSTTQPAIPSPATQQSTYSVASGDNLSKIAAKYGTTVSALVAANPQYASLKTNPNLIQPGWNLNIPEKTPLIPVQMAVWSTLPNKDAKVGKAFHCC